MTRDPHQRQATGTQITSHLVGNADVTTTFTTLNSFLKLVHFLVGVCEIVALI